MQFLKMSNLYFMLLFLRIFLDKKDIVYFLYAFDRAMIVSAVVSDVAKNVNAGSSSFLFLFFFSFPFLSSFAFPFPCS